MILTKKINIAFTEPEQAIFMGTDELCNPLSTNNTEVESSVEIDSDLNINIIIKNYFKKSS